MGHVDFHFNLDISSNKTHTWVLADLTFTLSSTLRSPNQWSAIMSFRLYILTTKSFYNTQQNISHYGLAKFRWQLDNYKVVLTCSNMSKCANIVSCCSVFTVKEIMCRKYSKNLLGIQMHLTYFNHGPIRYFCMQQILFYKGKTGANRIEWTV